MKKNYDVIVVGSGIGGMCSAAMLSQAGYKVLVLEKNNILGGRASSFEKDGFIVDTGIHTVIVTSESPLANVLERIKRPDAIQYYRFEHHTRPKAFLTGKSFVYPDPSYASEQEIRAFYKEMGIQEEDCDELLAIDKKIYGFSKEESTEFDNITYLEMLKKYTDNQMVLLMHASRTQVAGGIGIEEASAGEMIRITQDWHLSKNYGVYPIGKGIGTIVETFADIIREYDGEVELNKPVESILVENGKAIGVKLKSGEEVKSRAVVSNAGVKSTILNLVPAGTFSEDYCNKVERLSYGALNDERCNNHLTFQMFLDEPIIKESVFGGIPVAAPGDGYGKRIKILDLINFDSPTEEEKKSLLGQIAMYATVPSNMDPSVAPPGKQLVNISGGSFPDLSIDENITNWKKIIDFLYPGIKDHIIGMYASRGTAWKNLSGHPVANGVGLGQIVGQVGQNRPSVECPVKGLFITGADVGKRKFGIELAADGAILSTDATKSYLQ